MENETKDTLQSGYEKEGFVPFMIQKGEHKFLIYVELGMPLWAAFDAAFDIAHHLRELYRQQVQKAVEQQQAAQAQAVAEADKK